nr:hypothetical protein CKG001_11340 [Bdellovibrio sp. CKG001]BFD62406.1 hypothetical protein BdHM001_10870 [Bdellovibrio sp. HM001]
METKSLNQISCEQVYNIWATEPHLLKILDLRDRAVFLQGHIPGAQWVPLTHLEEEVGSLGNRLAVLVAPEHLLEELGRRCGETENCVLLSRCERWAQLKKPLAGNGVEAIVEQYLNKGEAMKNDIIFHQLFDAESSTYTYLIADPKSKEAALIDPVLETVDRDLKLIEELGLRLMYVLDTHIHADHITGAGEIRRRTGVQTAVSKDAQVDCVDIPLEDGQELLLGDKKIHVLATPGHTNTCMTYVFEGRAFTGDALLIRGCGRTDFQQGSSERLYDSVTGKLYQLPAETIVYPGHDYRGMTSSTIGTEKMHNPRLNERISKEQFQQIMSDLKLANPRKIHEAVPANLACGVPRDHRVFHPQTVDGIPEVSVDDVHNKLPAAVAGNVRLIDVRRPDEFNGEYGHIAGAELVTLGPELTAFLEKGDRSEEIVFICRSGGRSGQATAESQKLGYRFTVNMTGGMIRWNEKKFLVERNKGE